MKHVVFSHRVTYRSRHGVRGVAVGSFYT